MIATKFAVAVHIMLLLSAADPPHPERPRGGLNTSVRIGDAVNTNPVVVRRITGQLVRAGLVRVHRGPGGAELALPSTEINLDHIWLALQPSNPKPLLSLHRTRTRTDDAGHMHRVIEGAFSDVEDSFRVALRRTTLDELAGRLRGSAV